MPDRPAPSHPDPRPEPAGQSHPPSQPEPDGDFGDFLQELRILLPGAQTLTAFLIILPFNSGFGQIQQGEKWVYVATFLCSVCALILFSAPAAQHRLQRPLPNREEFKNDATRLIIIGLVPLSLALILASHLVIAQALADQWVAWAVAGIVAILIGAMWWLVPIRAKRERAANQ
ncbi:MAG TPA: DUF6328 family protein [Thermomicrobiales bacterium]|nr:DUF6328 family protein [Thermomicrobiales bacterium]